MTMVAQKVDISSHGDGDLIYTYDQMVQELGDTNTHYELWDGKIVTAPAPFSLHQYIIGEFYDQLKSHVRPRRKGTVLFAPCDLVLSEHLVLQPDVLFIAKAASAFVGKKPISEIPELVMEVVSLATKHKDRIEKKDRYEHFGVKEYWIIDPEAITVEVFSLEMGEYKLFVRARHGERAGSKLLPGFEVEVDSLFPPPQTNA